MAKFNDFSFHESTVTSFEGKDGKFAIKLEDVKYNDEVEDVLITVKNVSKMTSDDSFQDELNMCFNDGEILSLELDGKKLFILIEWNDFPTKNSQTIAYEISGKYIQIHQRSKPG